MKINFPVLREAGQIGDALVYNKTEATMHVKETVKVFPLDIYLLSDKVVVAKKKSDLLEFAIKEIEDRNSKMGNIDKSTKHFFTEDIEKTVNGENLRETIKENIEKLDLEKFDTKVVLGENVVEEIDTDAGKRYMFPWSDPKFEYVPEVRIIRTSMIGKTGFNLKEGIFNMIVYHLVPFGYSPNSRQRIAVINERGKEEPWIMDIGQEPCNYRDGDTFNIVNISRYFDYHISPPQPQAYAVRRPLFSYKQDYIDFLNQFKKAKKSYNIKQLTEEILDYAQNNIEVDLPPMVKIFTQINNEKQIEGMEAIKTEMGITESYYDEKNQTRLTDLDRSYPRVFYLVKPFKFKDSPASKRSKDGSSSRHIKREECNNES